MGLGRSRRKGTTTLEGRRAARAGSSREALPPKCGERLSSMAEMQCQRRNAVGRFCLHLVRSLHDQEGGEALRALLRFQDFVMGRKLPGELERPAAIAERHVDVELVIADL